MGIATGGMSVASIFSTKGGPGKTTMVFNLAAGIKRLIPTAKVGIIDETSDQGALSGEWASEKEESPDGLGAWRLIHTLADPMASRRAGEILPSVLASSVTKIRVIPNRPEEEACIELINTGRDIGKDVRDLPKVIAPNAHEAIAAPILEQIATQLGWDFCLLDLPGSIQDSLSRMFLPNCSTVIIPHDLRSEMNFHGFPDLMGTLQALNVPVSGFLINQAENSEAFRSCRAILEEMAQGYGVPVVGEVDSFLTIRKSLQRVRPEERLGDLDAEAGLYRMLDAKFLFGAPINRSTKALVSQAIGQIEDVARKVIETCGVAIPSTVEA